MSLEKELARLGTQQEKSFQISTSKIRLFSDPAVFFPTSFAKNMGLLLSDNFTAGETVCELGTGSGVLAILAGLKGARVVGLDKNPRALALSTKNWVLNGLPPESAEFRDSDLFSGIKDEERGTFDAILSNPPLLPDINKFAQDPMKRESCEVAGPLGRNVLDAMLFASKDLLKIGGRMYTIATSLQGWERTRDLLDSNWQNWRIAKEIELELTYECGPIYVEWWRQEQDVSGEQYLYNDNDKLTHKLWFIEATHVG